eukprot:scaffold17.g581.t1
MASKPLAVVERFNRDRAIFASGVGELARDASNVTALEQAGAGALLIPLLADPLPGVQHSATFALGRLAGHSEAVAAALVEQGAVDTLVAQLQERTDPADAEEATRLESYGQQRAALFALRSVIKHSPALAAAALGGGRLAALVGCLAAADAEVREGCCWVLELSAGHSPELAAQLAADPRLLPLLVGCVGAGQGLVVQRVAASALAAICKHPALAPAAASAGALPTLVAALAGGAGGDAKLRRQAAAGLAALAKASPELAAALATVPGLLPELGACLASDDALVRRYAGACLLEVAMLGEETARALAAAPGVLPGLAAAAAAGLLSAVMAAGYVASYGSELAAAVAAAGLEPALASFLHAAPEDQVRVAATWALGQLGRHGAPGAMGVAATGALPRMVELASADASSDDLRAKCRKALQFIIQSLDDIAVLAALLELPLPEPEVMGAALARCATVLAARPAARTLFAAAGALRRAEEIGEAPGSPHADAVQRLCSHFPLELVQLYSPAYHARLLAALELEAEGGGAEGPPREAGETGAAAEGGTEEPPREATEGGVEEPPHEATEGGAEGSPREAKAEEGGADGPLCEVGAAAEGAADGLPCEALVEAAEGGG